MAVAVPTPPNHQEFLRELRDGHPREIWVAALLLDTGLPVRVEPLVEARTPWEGGRFTEQNDVIVGGHIVEVKSSSRAFTSAEDWPFPDANVCTVKRWEARRVKPVAFVLVSQPTHALLAISAKTFPLWTIAVSKDGRREGWPTPTYRTPKATLRSFGELVEAFRRWGGT